MESQTPAAPSTDQTTATATTVTMPKAIDSRNAVFITDHGSRCTNLRRARRGAPGRAPGAPAPGGGAGAGGGLPGAPRPGAPDPPAPPAPAPGPPDRGGGAPARPPV